MDRLPHILETRTLLKPWVAGTLFWFFKAGLIIVPLVVFGFRIKLRENFPLRAWLYIAPLWIAVCASGHFIDFTPSRKIRLA